MVGRSGYGKELPVLLERLGDSLSYAFPRHDCSFHVTVLERLCFSPTKEHIVRVWLMQQLVPDRKVIVERFAFHSQCGCERICDKIRQENTSGVYNKRREEVITEEKGQEMRVIAPGDKRRQVARGWI